jgi:hypothetical protein
MKIVTIVSPDKITQSMFSDYFRKMNNMSEVVVLDINSLFSPEVQENALNQAIEHVKSGSNEGSSVILIKYKVKARTEPILNTLIEDSSELVVKFDLFSTHPIILKDLSEGSYSSFFEGWMEHVEILNS